MPLCYLQQMQELHQKIFLLPLRTHLLVKFYQHRTLDAFLQANCSQTHTDVVSHNVQSIKNIHLNTLQPDNDNMN